MMKAYSYIRFSTPEQLKGDSLRRQLDASEKYAKEHRLTLDTSLNLRDLGLSAYRGTHRTKGALGEFLELVRKGKIEKGSVLIVESLDRLSRERVTAALSQFNDIVEAGIKLVTLQDRMEYDKESIDKNWTQLVVSITYMARANEESRIKSERLAAAWEQKRKNGKILTGKCPAWLTLSEDRKEFIVRKEVARVIKRIFQLKLEGIGEERIANELNNSKLWQPPISGRNKSGGWRKSYIAKILRNPAVVGEYTPHKLVKVEGKGDKRYKKNTPQPVNGIIRQPAGDPMPNYYPAIIDEKTFNRTQHLIAQESKRGNTGGQTGKATNLFVHLAICGICKSPMHLIDKGKLPKGGQYLHCDKSRRKLGCDAKPIRYDEFQQIIFNDLEELDLSQFHPAKKEFEKQVSSLQAGIEDYQHRLKVADQKIINLFDYVGEYGKSADINKHIEQARSNKSEIEKQLRELESERAMLLEVASNSLERIDVVKEVKALLERARTEEQKIDLRLRLRGELRKLIDYIKVHPLQRKYVPAQELDTGEVLFMSSKWLESVTIKFKGSKKLRILQLSVVGEPLIKPD